MQKNQQIESLLVKALNPSFIEVIDESHHHAGHNPDAAHGGTHFKVTVVSDAFKGKRLVECHRIIYGLLKEENIDYHALAINAKS